MGLHADPTRSIPASPATGWGLLYRWLQPSGPVQPRERQLCPRLPMGRACRCCRCRAGHAHGRRGARSSCACP
eukprot:1371508-Pyramimonas_sp.AAC.1